MLCEDLPHGGRCDPEEAGPRETGLSEGQEAGPWGCPGVLAHPHCPRGTGSHTLLWASLDGAAGFVILWLLVLSCFTFSLSLNYCLTRKEPFLTVSLDVFSYD